MNARFSLLSAAFLSFVFCAPAGAADLTLTYAPTSSSDTGAKTIGDITVTPTYEWKVSESFGWSSSMLQIGKTSFNVTNIVYDFSAFPADVKSVAVTGKTSAGNNGYTIVSAKIGSADFAGSASLTNGEGTITLTAPEGTQTGNLSVSIYNPKGHTANSSSQAIYLKSIVVTYKDPAAAGLTQLGTPANLSATSTNYFGFTLSWNSVTYATNGYTVTLSPAEGNSGVTVSGTTATMTGLAEGATYDVSVVAKGDGTGTDDSEAATLLGVKTLTAPPVSEPDLMYTVSASALTVSWPAQNDASFSVLAWTNKPVNAANENFAKYAADGTVPDGWLFENGRNHYTWSDAPVDFRASGSSQVDQWIGTPEFGGPVSTVSFHIRKVSAVTGTFTVYGSTGSTNQSDWVEIKTLTNAEIDTGDYSFDEFENGGSLAGAGFTRLFFRAVKSAGGFAFGSFSVTGTGVGKEPVYLPGYGSTPTAVAGTSVTFADPVVGETYCVEVTATGLSGRTATSTLTIPVSRRLPSVISVK